MVRIRVRVRVGVRGYGLAINTHRPLVTRVGGGDRVEGPPPGLRTRAVMRAPLDWPRLAGLPTLERPARVDRPSEERAVEGGDVRVAHQAC